MVRLTISSSRSTSLGCARLMPRMAAWGQTTTGVKAVPPMPPWLEIVKLAPSNSSGLIFLVAGPLGRIGDLYRQLDDALVLNVADHGHQQSPGGVHGHADMDIILVDHLFVGRIDAGVEARVALKGDGADFHQHRGEGQLAAFLLRLPAVPVEKRLHITDVGLVELGHLGYDTPRGTGVLRRQAPHRGQLLGASGTPAAEIGQGRLSGERSRLP